MKNSELILLFIIIIDVMGNLVFYVIFLFKCDVGKVCNFDYNKFVVINGINMMVMLFIGV